MPPQKISADQTILFLQRAFSQIKSPLKKTVMTVPPTITKQAAFVQPQFWTVPLLNAVLVKVLPVNPGPFDSRFHMSAPEMLSVRATGGYNDGTIYNMLGSISPSNFGGSGLTVIRWCTDARYFGLAFRWSPSFMLTCDGEYVSAAPITHPVLGASSNYVSFSHSTRKPREYCLMLGAGLDFGGIAVGPNDTVWAPSIPDLRIVADGDSYLQSASSSFSSGIFSETAMAIGADFCCAPIGGTGYVGTSGPYPNALTRISQVTAPYNGKSNIVMIALGINDPVGPPLVAGVTAYYAQLRAALPYALFVVVGPWCPVETYGPTYYSARSSVIFSAVQAAGGPYILLDNINGVFKASWGATGSLGGLPWQTGTGKVGAPTGKGNGDVYVSSDGTHATVAGIDYLSVRVFSALAIAVNSYVSP